ncbi:MAG: phage holin family protein [Verrucomicrobia bacterium]|nr:phage holin family protein [Verrucomicrobiota bacterium]
MLRFIVKVIVLGAVILGLAHVLPGLYVPNFTDALLFALIVAIFNASITPFLIIISFPLTVLTIGIFALLINALVFWVASLVSYGVEITSFWGAFWGSIIVAIVSFALSELLQNIPKKKRPQKRN